VIIAGARNRWQPAFLCGYNPILLPLKSMLVPEDPLMSRCLLLTLFVVPLLAGQLAGAEEEGFVSLWDGKTLDGWKINENPDSWSIRDGAIVANGERSHLFYTGSDKPFKNFILKVDCKTEENSNGGIYFHTKFQEEGWPAGGFEAQVNNTYHHDPKLSGSLYGVSNVLKQHIPDNQWWTQTIKVEGNHVQILLDDEVVVDYYEPPGTQKQGEFERRLSQGTFAFQAHDPGSTVHFKNIRVKRLD
jgi:hypothetical protein